jgi:hypothetical protein
MLSPYALGRWASYSTALNAPGYSVVFDRAMYALPRRQHAHRRLRHSDLVDP